MKASRLLMYKASSPMSYLPSRKPNGPIFGKEDFNNMIDLHHERFYENRYEKLMIPYEVHEIEPDSMPLYVKNVAKRLKDNGFEAYLCGGTVRDLLQNVTVSDYDIVTDASNEDLKKIFDTIAFHSIPTGHEMGYIVFGQEMLDVCTMTNVPSCYQGIQHLPAFDPKSLYSKDLLFDALQRDFTINALYYDLKTGNIIDWAGGLYDLREGIIRSMVLAENEFRYDPRKLLRAIRFKARFGFEFSEDVERVIKEQGKSLLKNISPYGVSKNLPDMFFGGYTRSSTKYLLQYDLFEILFPDTASMCKNVSYQKYAMKVAYVVDWLYDEGCVGLPLLAMSALLWPTVERYYKSGYGMEEAAAKILESQRKIMSMTDEEADFMYNALLIDEMDDERSIVERLDSIFGPPEFEDALGVLRLNYVRHRIEMSELI